MQFLQNLSPVAFGCDPLGGHNWGKVDPDAVMAAIPYALDRGITTFDTADCYGNGLSEIRLGQALGRRRHEAMVASKFGVRIGNDGKTVIDNDPKWIAEALDGSLKRLGTDVIDIYQLHWWDGKTPFSDIFHVLEGFRSAGKIRAFGATNVTLEMMGMSTAAELPAGFATSSMEFSLVYPANRDTIKAMCGTWPDKPAFLAWGSLGGGMLSGKYRSASDFAATDRRLKRPDSHFVGERLEKNLRIVDVCRAIAADHGDQVKVSQVALQWISRTLGFGTCLVGIKGRDQLDDAVGSFDFQLSKAEVLRLDEAAQGSC